MRCWPDGQVAYANWLHDRLDELYDPAATTTATTLPPEPPPPEP